MINKENYNRLPSKARYSMLIGSIIGLGIGLIVLVSIWQVLHIFKIPQAVYFWYKCIGGLIIACLLLDLILSPSLGYHRYLYRINDESIDIIKGIFFIEHTVIPIRRMQQVDIVTGPINKFFKLVDISITTAGGVASIDYIPLDQADILVENLKKKINERAV
nr:PH domain-containing protein [uncultured Peptostreptococcus sp.]